MNIIVCVCKGEEWVCVEWYFFLNKIGTNVCCMCELKVDIHLRNLSVVYMVLIECYFHCSNDKIKIVQTVMYVETFVNIHRTAET